MPVRIDYHACIGCKACYTHCPADMYGWDDEKEIPYAAYPDECWHCGICKLECPKDAIRISMPIMTWLDINKRFISRLSSPMELKWPGDE
jgi:adenylylsulfate reductase subunit B